MSLEDRINEAMNAGKLPEPQPKLESDGVSEVDRMRVTLVELAKKHIDCNFRIGSKSSIQQYSYAVNHFGKTLGRVATIADLTEENLTKFIRARRAVASVHTVNREASRIVTLWKFAANLRYCDYPTVQLKRTKPPEPEAWLEHEVRALFDAASRYEGRIKSIPAHIYLLAMLSLFFYTGERLTPILQLKRADVDLRGRWVTMRNRKGNAPDKRIRIRLSTVTHLSRLMELHDQDLVFAGAHRSTLYYHLPQVLAMAGLPVTRRNKFHKLRRTHASHLHAAGGNATDSLGHSTDAVTRESYLDKRITQVESPADLLFDPEQKPGLLGRLLGKFRRKGTT